MYDIDFSITQVNSDKGRHYEVTQKNGNKHKLVSVTTLLDKFKDKSALFAWRENIGAEKAQEITTQAANRGTATHLMSENYLLKGILAEPEDNDSYKCFSRLLPILNLITPIQIEEKTYWVSTESGNGFAGTTDMWASLDGRKLISRTTNLPLSDGQISFIGDIKTWNKTKYPIASCRDGSKYYPLVAYGLQLSAYAAAINQRTNGAAGLNNAFIFAVTNNCRAPFIYHFPPDAILFYWGKIKQMIHCLYSNQWFDWKQMEAEAARWNFLGDRCDIASME